MIQWTGDERDGTETVLKPGDILVFDTLMNPTPKLYILRCYSPDNSPRVYELLGLDEEGSRHLSICWINHRDKIRELLMILKRLFNFYFKECSLSILPRDIIRDENFTLAFEVLKY